MSTNKQIPHFQQIILTPMLTDTQVKNLKPKAKLYRKADSNGLCIEVKPSGKRFWRYRYRYNNKPTMYSIGEYSIIKLAQARQERDNCRALLTKYINPNKHKEEQKAQHTQQEAQTQTFEQVFYEWHKINQDGWKPSYSQDIIQRANSHILPHIGNKNIGDITPQTMIEVLKRIEEKGRIDTLQKVKSVCSRVFRYCVGVGILEHNPVGDLPSDIFKRKQTKHYATITDPKEIGILLKMIDGYGGTYQVETALKIAPYVFLRPSN